MNDSLHEAHYKVRDALVDALRDDLLGPRGGTEEVLRDDAPITMYPVGVLFPRAREDREEAPAEGPAVPEDELEAERDGLDTPRSASGRTRKRAWAIWASRWPTCVCPPRWG